MDIYLSAFRLNALTAHNQASNRGWASFSEQGIMEDYLRAHIKNYINSITESGVLDKDYDANESKKLLEQYEPLPNEELSMLSEYVTLRDVFNNTLWNMLDEEPIYQASVNIENKKLRTLYSKSEQALRQYIQTNYSLNGSMREQEKGLALGYNTFEIDIYHKAKQKEETALSEGVQMTELEKYVEAVEKAFADMQSRIIKDLFEGKHKEELERFKNTFKCSLDNLSQEQLFADYAWEHTYNYYKDDIRAAERGSIAFFSMIDGYIEDFEVKNNSEAEQNNANNASKEKPIMENNTLFGIAGIEQAKENLISNKDAKPSVSFAGNLTKDPELKNVSSSDGREWQVTTLRVGVNEKDQAGNDKKEFIDVELWNNSAKEAVDTLKQGSFVKVDGQMTMNTSSKDGETRNFFRVSKSTVTPIERSAEKQATATSEVAAASAPVEKEKPAKEP
ncbi:MAG: single-stranded DNA-binding protein, partial [Firmicutes bacterium]|nr:single-stranded DNA-binding protein [Bacillota bacterium]